MVDSPPGITKALTVFNSSGFLTFCTATLRELNELMCSRKSPCSAKTPTLNKSYQPRPANLSVVLFTAGGIATPADAALMMQLGADGVFVGYGIFK